MHATRASFWTTHRRTILALLFGLAFSATLAYAVPPSGGYGAGDTLDPDCAPGDTDCIVQLPTGGSSQWDDVTGGINYADGNVGIGTTTPDTALDVVGTITGTNLNIVGNAITVSAPTNLSAVQTQVCASGCAYTADGSSGSPINYRVYSYKIVGSERVYSSTYATLSTNFIDDSSNDTYDVTVSWTAAAGADGYRILLFSPNYYGANYDMGYDTTNTSFIDDGGTNVLFDSGMSEIVPTSGYSNAASINGQLTVSGTTALIGNVTVGTSGVDSVFSADMSDHYVIMGGVEGALNGTTFEVEDASQLFTFTNGSVVITSLGGSGTQMLVVDNDGLVSTQPVGNAWGSITGTLADQTDLQNALDTKFNIPTGNTGQYIRGDGTLATYSASAITVQNSNSLFSTGLSGSGSGSNAVNSLFLLTNSGSGATNASNSIFLGRDAGLNDSVNNTAAYNDSSTFANTSILIGHRTSTGGFSNSIAIGAYAVNTGSDQLVIGSIRRPVSSVHIGNGSGTGSTSGTIFIGPRAGFNATNAVGSNFLGSFAGENASNASLSNFFGQLSGSSATNASDSNFFGENAGAAATNASHSNFFGESAGSNGSNSANSFFVGRGAGSYSNGVGGTQNAANSIFIGTYSGTSLSDGGLNNTAAYDDLATFANTSILIGHRTSTAGFENSIALGAYAANTASNEFMIGSANRPIDSTVFVGTAGTSCTITTGTSMSCSSDERLKTNIEDLETDTLDKLLSVRTVSYNWTSRPDADPMVGFLAQDLEQYFPQLVTTGPQDYLQVNYAGMTPILVEAIREMNLKITSINDIDTDNSWRDALVDWFASATNGIGSFFSKEIHTETLCVKKSDGSEICLDGDQIESLTGGQGTIIINNPAPEEVPDPVEVTPETDSGEPEEVAPTEGEPEVTLEEPQEVVTEEVVEEPAPEPQPAPEAPSEAAPTE